MTDNFSKRGSCMPLRFMGVSPMKHGREAHATLIDRSFWKSLIYVTLLLLIGLSVRADDPLIVTFETPSFTLDTRLPGDVSSTNSLLVQADSPNFTLDTRLPTGDKPDVSLIVQSETQPFTLDTRLPDGVVPFSGTVVTESGTFTLDTRLPDGVLPEGALVIAVSSPFTLDTLLPTDTSPTALLAITAETPPFTLDTRLPSDTTPLLNLITQTESPPFTLDTRIVLNDPLNTNYLTMAVSGSFTLDTLSGNFPSPIQTLTGGDTGGKARFSPDGLRLAKTDGNRVLLWNLHSAKSNTVFSGHNGMVVSLEFSPLGDQLLTGAADGTVRMWDTASREELSCTITAGSGTAYATLASDGARALTGLGTSVSLYHALDMQALRELPGMSGSAEAVALCPEGLALAGSSTREALLWDTATGAMRLRFTNHTHMVTAAAFFTGGGRAMTASMDGTIRVWSTADGTERLRIDQRSPVADAVLSADGELLATCDTGTPGAAYLWDAQTGDMVRVFTDTGNEASAIKGVALSPDHTLLATTHADGRVRLWDTGLSPRPTQTVIPLGMATNVPVTLRSHGLYYFEVDAKAGHNLVVTLEAAPAPAPAAIVKGMIGLSVASPTGQAISSDAEFANLGGVAGKASAHGCLQLMGFRPTPVYADVTAFRMTAKKGDLPSEYDYDTFTQASAIDLHCEMPLATGLTNKVFVLVFAPYLSAGSIQARIRAEYADFHLSSVVPARGGSGGNVTARLQGTGLTPDTTARLVGPGGVTVASQLAMLADSTKAWFTFALSNAPAGSYQVEISKPGVTSAVLAGNFQVVNAVGPQLQSSLTAPSAVRPGRDYGMTLTYANVGDTDMAAPLFIVSAADQRASLYNIPKIKDLVWTQIRNPASTPRVAQMQILGLNQDGPPSVLPPGASYEIPLYFQGDGSVWNMAFNLSVLKADSSPIDWPALEAKLRPADMAPDLWVAVWANFKAIVGGTWADYLHALDNQAHSLALSGQPSYDVGDMLGALFSQALGSPYRRTLAAAVDAQAPSPALPLQFSRFATDSLEQRFSVGPLGRGWSHSFEYALTRPTNGVIVIRTPGGGGRRFTLGAGNVWQAGTGDYATLTATAGGGFALLEKEGVLWQFAADSRLLSVEEPNHNHITLTYSGGRLTGLSHSAGPSFALGYNGQGRLVSLIDHAGQVTTYDYDATGEYLVSVTAPGAVRTGYVLRSKLTS